MITIKTFLISLLVAAILVAAMTRYFFPLLQTKIVEVEKEVIHENIVTVTHTVTTPAGIIDTTTTTTDRSIKSIIDNKTIVMVHKPTINISALIGKDFHKSGFEPLYGVSVSKEFIGPVTIGAFGLTSSVVGVTIGLNF
jgi:hypothetical protein